MPESVKAEAIKAGIPILETTSLASVLGSTDVLYVTRVQQERFENLAEYESVKDAYVVNNELLSRAKAHCIVMHPLPRNAELDPEVDVRSFPASHLRTQADFLLLSQFDQRRAAYFRQMRFGLFVRMSLLALVMGGSS